MYTNSYGAHYRIIRYSADWTIESLSENLNFDCFLVNLNHNLSNQEIKDLAVTLVKSSCDWVEVFGCDAEVIHDAIDMAAVAIGRQFSVGDGDPMTSWNDKSMTESKLAAYLWTGGQGVADWKLLLIIGDEDAEKRLSAEINSLALRSPTREDETGTSLNLGTNWES